MTGYLHLRDEDELRHRLGHVIGFQIIKAEADDDNAIEWHPCCDQPMCPAAQSKQAPCPCSGSAFASTELLDAVLAVLRGLSVEPTEPTDEQTAAATDRLMMSHPSWFKRLSTVRNRSPQDPGYQDARYAALTLATAVLRAAAAPVPVQEDRPTCEHGKREAHWYPNPACEERWPECISCGYDPRCCRWPKSCSADERCNGPAAESSGSALVVQEDRP